LEFYGKLCGIHGAQLRERVPELLAMVDLELAADRSIAGYSKGMLQRIGLAQAIVHRPRLVVLDEPTAGVDPRGSRHIRDLILQMKAEGISVILSSHLLEQVQEVCDRAGIIYKGRMVLEGRLEDLTQLDQQMEYVVEGGSTGLEEKIRTLVEQDGGRLLSSGHPRTTLEKLFLRQPGIVRNPKNRQGPAMTETESSSRHVVPVWEISPLRIWVLAQGTFVQLVRMRVFYFLLIFVALVLVIAGAGLFWLPTEHLPGA